MALPKLLLYSNEQWIKCQKAFQEPNVFFIIHDIIGTGENYEEHLKIFKKILEHLEEYALQATFAKYNFFQESVAHCRDVIDAQGLHKYT